VGWADAHPAQKLYTREENPVQTIHLRSHVGEDGILHLDIPVNISETDLEVTVIVHPVSPRADNSEIEDFNKLEWHEFIERTAGALADDESFFRHPQGEAEIRESLE
jgi:hypothetical protein